jgi:hypothetical protein
LKEVVVSKFAVGKETRTVNEAVTLTK